MAASTRPSARDLAMVAPPAAPSEEFEEISLVDIVRVLYRRRVVLALALAASLVAGGALTYFTTPEYEATASVIPLEHVEIIRNWMGSRQAAEFALGALGERLYTPLFGDQWDAAAGAWSGAPPSDAEVALRLMPHVRVGGAAKAAAAMTVSVTMEDPTLARDVAAAYVDSLAALRPQLENITRSELFDKYYDGTNSQEAQRRAETAAREKSYWLTFDSPTIPESPVKPRPVLYMSLAAVLGIMGGMLLVFGIEWMSKYRSEFSRVEPPR